MMNKFLNTKVLYIFISVIILIMFFLLVMRACSQKQPIQATVTPSDPVVGKKYFFRFHVGSENLVLGVRKQRDIHTTQRIPSVQAKRGVQNTTDRQRKSGTLL